MQLLLNLGVEQRCPAILSWSHVKAAQPGLSLSSTNVLVHLACDTFSPYMTQQPYSQVNECVNLCSWGRGDGTSICLTRQLVRQQKYPNSALSNICFQQYCLFSAGFCVHCSSLATCRLHHSVISVGF